MESSVLLEGFDGWNHGLDLVDGTLQLIAKGNLLRFDPSTGAALGPALPLVGLSYPRGLTCVEL